MDQQRLILYFALALILMLLWQAWEQQHAPPPTQQPSAGPPDSPPSPAPTPSTPAPGGDALERGTRIEVRTDLFKAEIDTQGGDLRQVWLLHYPLTIDKPDAPFRLLADSGDQIFIAQSGLIGHETNYPTHKSLYAPEATRYVLEAGQTELRVPLTWRAPDGVRYIKTHVFRRDSYVIAVEFTVINETPRPWSGFMYGQFVRSPVEEPGIFAVPTYTGGAIYTFQDKYQKISFSDIASKPLRRDSTGGWVAMLQHYFVSAWMPVAAVQTQFYTDVIDTRRYVIGYKDVAPTAIAPHETGRIATNLYVGPKEQQRLEQLAPGMELTIDYGWLTVISAPLFLLLSWIHQWVGNWGWAIVILTFLIKLVFYPLSAASYKSMAHMKQVQPKLQNIKERYGDDKQKLNQAMMELYKTEKINPLGGCLPILIQIPVFIALYWVLLESVEMRHAPFVLWIKDLSGPDPYFVLPILMGVTMYAQQLLNPTPVDPVQKKVFMALPFVFTVFFMFFPAGLVLYWLVNNILSIAQQWRITRVIEAKAK